MWNDGGNDGGSSSTWAQESAYKLIRRQADQSSVASATPDVASWTSSAASPSSTSSGSGDCGSNSTQGTYCVTSLLDELSSYLGTELSLREIATIALGGNATAIQALESIPPTALCNDCIFGALSLVETEFPEVGTSFWIGNSTLNQFLDTTCNSTGLVVSQSKLNLAHCTTINTDLPPRWHSAGERDCFCLQFFLPLSFRQWHFYLRSHFYRFSRSSQVRHSSG